MRYKMREKDKEFINNIERHKNPMYKHRLDGFVWGFVIGLIPYLWHMYI